MPKDVQPTLTTEDPFPPSELRNLVDRIKPRAQERDLIRIGGQGDGGYLIPDDVDGISACFSPGVSSVAAFEADLADRYGIRSYLADFSVESAPINCPLFEFEKKFLGIRDDISTMRLEDWFDRNAESDADADYLLQMDIEGAEISVLIDTPRRVLRRFRIMVIEFHSMQMLLNRRWRKFYGEIFDKLLDDFIVAHIHPNNCCGVVSDGDLVILKTFEMTFYRSDRTKLSNRSLRFPHPLDQKNVPSNEDIILPNCWWRPKQSA